jgi:DNA-binding NtrC family response regulator
VSQTLSNLTEEAAATTRAEPHLFRVLAAHRPDEAPARHALGALAEVRIGRGDRTGWRRDGDRLRIDIADGWASQEHARMTRSIGRWQVEDLGSKNGTLVNGVKVERTLLADGDVLEIGRTFLLHAGELEVADGDADAGADQPLPGLATLSPGFARGLAQLAAIAPTDVAVMLLGGTGTGKEVAARAVHAASRRGGDFVAVNCGALPANLVESTLFGHRRGAFSGAVEDAPGAVRSADRGTLFLDEIGDLPAAAQATLLRVLQEREVTPLGASRPVPVDLRVICATHRELSGIRTDLLYRLRGFTLALPALADRRCDLGLLAGALIRRRGGAATLAPRAARALLAHAWPGNVRELEQALAAALALAGGSPVGPEHLRERLVGLLAEHRGNVRAIARAVGKDPVQVRRWLRRFGLDAESYRGD